MGCRGKRSSTASVLLPPEAIGEEAPRPVGERVHKRRHAGDTGGITGVLLYWHSPAPVPSVEHCLLGCQASERPADPSVACQTV